MTTVGSCHSTIMQEIYVIFIDQLQTHNSFMLNWFFIFFIFMIYFTSYYPLT